MVSGGIMVIVRLAVFVRCVGRVASVTVTETLLEPAVVGEPVIWPAGERLRPAGRPVAVNV